MRLGVIEFGQPYGETAPLLAALREPRGIDIVTRLADPPQSIREEAQRLHRADCDGVLMTLGAGVRPDDVAEAILYTHSPVLVLSSARVSEPERHFDTNLQNLVASLAVTCDFISPSRAVPDRVTAWLEENGKSNRQKGIEAAHKLYGVRLLGALGDDRDQEALKLTYLRQFGILLRDHTDWDETRSDDIVATAGIDTVGALTKRLLHLVSGSDEVILVERSELTDGDATAAEIAFTFASIGIAAAPSHNARPVDGFYGRIFRGTRTGDAVYRIGRDPFWFLQMRKHESDFRLFAVAGDHVGALRAAFHTLDIPTVVLRDEPT